jgi:hypothetical protein
MLAAYIFQVLPACTWRQIKHNHTELAATRSTTRRWTRRSIAPASRRVSIARSTLKIALTTRRLLGELHDNAVAHEHGAVKVAHSVLGIAGVLEFDKPESIQHTHVDNRSYTIE